MLGNEPTGMRGNGIASHAPPAPPPKAPSRFPSWATHATRATPQENPLTMTVPRRRGKSRVFALRAGGSGRPMGGVRVRAKVIEGDRGREFGSTRVPKQCNEMTGPSGWAARFVLEQGICDWIAIGENAMHPQNTSVLDPAPFSGSGLCVRALARGVFARTAPCPACV